MNVYVYTDWSSEERQPRLAGTLYAAESGNRSAVSFAFSSEWLSSAESSLMLDPDLFYFEGRQYLPAGKQMFGLFSDSAPDRWGRTLIKRREAISAEKEHRSPRNLTEIDYLLGVYDASRMGALRFSKEEGGPFLSDDQRLAAPPWTTLRELEHASLAFESDDPDEEKWLNMLIAPGSSLGGARPKASVVSPDGSLWIAKFPSRHDSDDNGAWEMTIHDLAVMCGIQVPDAKLERFSEFGSTFLVKRFDREMERRIHFESSMTLLGRTDGASGSDGTSYLDLANFIKMYGNSDDLKELYRRIIFSVAVNNTDDHLRNHGFLMAGNSWRLSPAYDINPNPYHSGLSLNISETDNRAQYSTVSGVSDLFNIPKDEADHDIQEIQNTVAENWEKIAKSHGISSRSIRDMSPAFNPEYK